jgi:ferric-dicitrate binding protein FerR (iron transport regulator)
MDARNEDENQQLEGSDYLWDGSGQPDPEVQKLESLLAKFRHDRPAPAFPEIVPQKPWTFFTRRMWLVPALAAAAVVVIASAIFFSRASKPTLEIASGWNVSGLEGAPRIGAKTIGGKTSTGMGIGQILETDHNSRAQLQSENVGRIEVDSDTRLRLLSTGESKQIALDRGTIHAFIWSPPGQFVVQTPSAVTVDLGCAYTLNVDDTGAGTVRTSIGWVGFKLNGREAFIPAGAACSTKPKVGPGTPYFEDASAAFRAALARFDFDDSTAGQRASNVAIVLAESRKRDALTLWHLLARVDETQRSLVYDRLRKLAPPPSGVTREGILRLDQSMLDLWWNALGFDDVSIWRHWEHSWQGTASPSTAR